MAPSKPQPVFDKDEKVLCFHGPLLYEAKIVDIDLIDSKDRKAGFKYKVHYKGWKTSWDDWVEEERLKKFNEENRELERNLRKNYMRQQREAESAKRETKSISKRRSGVGASDRVSGRGSEERSISAQPPMTGRGTKRGRDLYENEKEENYHNRPSVKIPLPDAIKSILVDDWENVTKNQTLISLPHPHPINDVLAEYQKWDKRTAGSADADILEEVIQGLREYFNKSIGRILLYRFERTQWAEMTDRMAGKRPPGLPKGEPDLKDKSPCDIYGLEHLSRLLCSMPELIAQTNMDAPSVSRLRDEIQKLGSWLGRNLGKFAGSYDTVSSDYINKNKGVF